MPSSYLILCRPLLLLPLIPPSIRVFSYESTLRMRWPKYWGINFSIILSVMQVYVSWFFALSQQSFGEMDIKALGASQLSGLGQTVL